MSSSTFDSNVIPYPARAGSWSAAALRSLMQSWEEEVATEVDSALVRDGEPGDQLAGRRMTGTALDGIRTHALTGQPNRDFLPGGFELRSVALPTEPERWVLLSRGECLLLAMTLRRAVSEQRGGAVDPESRAS
jgi:hypothetical protein